MRVSIGGGRHTQLGRVPPERLWEDLASPWVQWFCPPQMYHQERQEQARPGNQTPALYGRCPQGLHEVLGLGRSESPRHHNIWNGPPESIEAEVGRIANNVSAVRCVETQGDTSELWHGTPATPCGVGCRHMACSPMNHGSPVPFFHAVSCQHTAGVELSQCEFSPRQEARWWVSVMV